MIRYYVWEKSDDIIGIAIKLTGSAELWYRIDEHNRPVWTDIGFKMEPGNIIEIPDDVVCNEKKYFSWPVARADLDNEECILMVKDITNELDALLHSHKRIPRPFVRTSKTPES